jgi:S1-C subfamily serine protease
MSELKAVGLALIVVCSSGFANAEDYDAAHPCHFDANYNSNVSLQDPSPSAAKFSQFLASLPEGPDGMHPLNFGENAPVIRAYIEANWETDASAASMRAGSSASGCYGYRVDLESADKIARQAAKLGDTRAIDYVARADSDESTGKPRSARKSVLRDGIQKLNSTSSWYLRDSMIEQLKALYVRVDLLPKIQKGRANAGKVAEMCRHFAKARDLAPRSPIPHIGLADCYQFTTGWREDLTLAYAHRLAYHWVSSTRPDTVTLEIERRLSSQAEIAEAERLAYRLTDRPLPNEQPAESVGSQGQAIGSLNAQPELESTGTAFFVSDSILVTNQHVIADAKKITVSIDGAEIDARLLVADPDIDLAVLEVVGAAPGPSSCFALDDADNAAAGTKIFAAGFPFTQILSSDPKITNGIVSSKNGVGGDPKTFQISAALQPGNSGGPVFNEGGQLVGIAVSGLTIGQNVNFAIKPAYLKVLLEGADIQAQCYNPLTIGLGSPEGFEQTLALVGNYQ